MRQRILRALPVAAGLAMFFVALEVLRVELRAVSWSEITADILRTPATRLAAAIGLTALNYLVLTGYDLLAFKYIRRALPRRRIVGASLLTYAISNSVGFAMFSGASVRYRFYTPVGRHGRRAVAHRLQLLGHVLAGPARARRTQLRPESAAGHA